MSPSKASGLDKLPVKLVKIAAHYFGRLLRHLEITRYWPSSSLNFLFPPPDDYHLPFIPRLSCINLFSSVRSFLHLNFSPSYSRLERPSALF